MSGKLEAKCLKQTTPNRYSSKNYDQVILLPSNREFIKPTFAKLGNFVINPSTV